MKAGARPRRLRWDIDARTALAIASASVLVTVLHAAVRDGMPAAGPLLVGAVTVLVACPVLTFLIRRLTHRGVRDTLVAVSDGLLSLAQRDYSLRLAELHEGELGALVRRFNALSESLRRERSDDYQREILFETVLATTALIVVLCDEERRIVHANGAARRFFGGGEKLEGRDLGVVVAAAPPELREALDSPDDVLFTHDQGEGAGPEAYLLSRRFFEIGGQTHTLVLLKPLTRELLRKEAETWKKAIRVLSHEVNNTLAPVTSLIHSSRVMLDQPEHAARLASALDTIEERAMHLCSFLEAYARFARLPLPSLRPVPWRDILVGLGELYPFQMEGELPAHDAYVDPAQMQQVLINLLKNAAESGSPPGDIRIIFHPENEDGLELEVVDRGKGMTAEVLRHALLPFFSTKTNGTGLGLPLCREIVDAHGGRLVLRTRPGGGIAVSCWLPAGPALGSAPFLPPPDPPARRDA